MNIRHLTTSLVSLAAMVLVVHPAAGAERYVSPSGTEAGGYTNWATAAKTIQKAVDACNESDTVWVTNGVYSITSQVSVTKGITVASVNGATATAIDGGGAHRCLYMGASNAIVDGFTIRNGMANTESIGQRYGGGVLIYTNGMVRNCIITNNVGGRAGGISIAWGGTVRNCLVAYNTCQSAGEYGGGISLMRGGVIENCTITQNSADSGGGLYRFNQGSVVNSIIYGNTANTYADIRGDPIVTYSCTPLVAGTGNTTNNPLFAADWHISTNSPCVDTGTNLDWIGGAYALDGNARLLGDRVDMGAYEAPLIGADTDSDGLPDWWEVQWFGVLTSALPNADPDNDGYTNLEEFQNGSNPTVFDVGSTYIWTAVEIGWKGIAGTNYQVQFTTNLSSGNWTNFGGLVVGNGSTNSVFDSTRTNAYKFYRVQVK